MKAFKWFAIILLILILAGTTVYMVYFRPFMQKMKETSVVQYDKELTIVLGGGGNSGILTSDSIVVVIDTKMDDAAEQLYKQAKEIAGNKQLVVINTHFHPDHIGGNKYYKGQAIIAGGNYTKENWVRETGGEESLPTEWLKGKMDIKMGDDTITLFNIGKNAHTTSDLVVYLHKRKMLFTGDLVLNKQAPVLIGGSDPDGYMAAFDLLQKQFDIQKIVPGHGAIGGPEVIENFRQYFIDMKAVAIDRSKEKELVAKYKDWVQVPFFMSPGATIDAISKKMWP